MKTPPDGWDRDEREALAPLAAELAEVRARHAGDPPLDLLRAAHADALPAELQARVAEHLADSPWSRALVAGASDVEHALDASDAERLLARINRRANARPSWLSNIRVWAPIAATAALVVIVAVAWSSTSRGRSAAPAAPPAVSAKPEATIARATPAPYQLPLDKPDVRLSIGALTWRGSSDTTLVDDLAPALDAYRQADYARAAHALEAIEGRYPASIEAPFYRGLSLLLLNDAAGAIVELQKADRLNDATFAPDVTWYLAVAEQRAGKTAAARAHLEALCAKTTPRTTAACDAITHLDGTR